MSTKVVPGRYTAELHEDLVVFLIGMRINKWWRIDKWLPVMMAMPKMLIHLAKQEDSPMLKYHNWFGRTTILVSYWRNVEELQRFASDPNAPHAAAWKRFNQAVGADGTVGVWHETYLTGPRAAEAVYANMPEFGLAAATNHVPVSKHTNRAHKRLNGSGPRDTTMVSSAHGDDPAAY